MWPLVDFVQQAVIMVKVNELSEFFRDNIIKQHSSGKPRRAIFNTINNSLRTTGSIICR